MKKCLSRGEYVSARVVNGIIEIFNRKNQIVCVLPSCNRFYRSLAISLVSYIDDGFCNFVNSKSIHDFFCYECKNEWGSMESAKRNWPKFNSVSEKSWDDLAREQRENPDVIKSAGVRNYGLEYNPGSSKFSID